MITTGTLETRTLNTADTATKAEYSAWVVGTQIQEIGVTFQRYGKEWQGVVKAVKWDALPGERDVEVESWYPIGDARYCWCTEWHYAADLVLNLNVVRPIEVLSALDVELAKDDGSEREALADRLVDFTFWANGYGSWEHDKR